MVVMEQGLPNTGLPEADRQPARSRDFEVRRMTAAEIPAVARMHYELLGASDAHGHSIASMGGEFLEGILYRPNADNPYFFCDVAFFRGEPIGFSVYSTRRTDVFRYSLVRKWGQMLWAAFRFFARHPSRLVSMLYNARYFSGEGLPRALTVDGWWIVAGVAPAYRSPEFEKETGVKVAAELFDRMEAMFREKGCASWYGAARQDPPINLFLQRRGARLVGTGTAQGRLMNYYVKDLRSPMTDNDSI